jgi:hypothetical protein
VYKVLLAPMRTAYIALHDIEPERLKMTDPQADDLTTVYSLKMALQRQNMSA